MSEKVKLKISPQKLKLVLRPNTQKVHIKIGGGRGGSGSAYVFPEDSVVQLASGNLGKYGPGDPIPWGGMNAIEFLMDAITDYLAPAFTSFSINSQPSLIEVGDDLSGAKTFTWGISNSSNLKPNSISIRDINAAVDLATGLANDGSEVLNIGTIDTSSPGTQSWRAFAENTQDQSLQSSLRSVERIYPIFYGSVAEPGNPGDNIPVANQSLINSGTKVVTKSNGTLTINFATGTAKYLWFAHPASETEKTVWYVNALNNGGIGGPSNLFTDPVTISIDQPVDGNWTSVSYKVYIGNYPTNINSNMELRNS